MDSANGWVGTFVERCSGPCLQFWDVLGTWVAAVATTAAVIVSLWLARRSSVRFTVSAGVRTIFGDGLATPVDAVAIEVRNVGERALTVEGIGWRFSPARRKQAFQLPSRVVAGIPVAQLPRTLPPGERVTFVVDLEPDENGGWAVDMARKFLGRQPWLVAQCMQVLAWTPTGITVGRRVEKPLRDLLLAAHRQIDPGKRT